MTDKYIIFDIETGPLSDEELKEAMPEFKAASNVKDPAKIQAQIDEKRQAWIESAALNPESGKVLAIGYKFSDSPHEIVISGETSMLNDLWALWISAWSTYTWAGHNIMGFDFPFLIRRSWILGVHVPKSAAEMTQFRHPHVEDTMQIWSLGSKEDRISLDRLGKLLKVGQKNGSGKDFAKVLEQDPKKAEEYLLNDLQLTEKVYLRLKH